MKQCAACSQSAETKAALCPHCGAAFAPSHTMPLLTGAKWLDFFLGMPLGGILLGIGYFIAVFLDEPLHLHESTIFVLIGLFPFIAANIFFWRRYPMLLRGMITALVIVVSVILGALYVCVSILKD